MKKRIGLFVGIHIIFTTVVVIVTLFFTKLQTDMRFNVYLGEHHVDTMNIAQIFYADQEKKLVKKVGKNASITVQFEDNHISFVVGDIDFRKDYMRLDPFNQKQDFSISKVTLTYGKYELFSITGKQFKNYVGNTKNIRMDMKGDILYCQSKNKNPAFIMNKEFSSKMQRCSTMINIVPYAVLFVLYLLLGLLEIWLMAGAPVKKGTISGMGLVFTALSLEFGVVVVYVVRYFQTHFGQVPFGQLVYHLHTPLDGTDISSYRDVIVLGVVVTIGVVILYLVGKWLLGKKVNTVGMSLWIFFLGTILTGYGCVKACLHFNIPEYYAYTHSGTTLYEENYVDGKQISITFPVEKRNLIYIFLESMEITYADMASGGIMTDNYIPELTALGLENETFSDGTGLNGAHPVSGATYTMGGLAAQTCGVPINENLVSNDTLNGTWQSENNYLPGVWSIGDILHEQGYNQEFLIGSDGNFAGRSSYFAGHGEYDVEDYNAAIDKGRIPSDYKVWWGYEDKKLFDFAKEDAMRLADSEEPFNLTLLTVDTHFTDGYVCDLCEDAYESQYSNVISCSDHQVAEFVQWVQKQSFYEDTTIVIAGDHLTPDSYYIANEGAAGFDRRTFFTIINPATGKNTDRVQRTYTTLDLYPTTLSAMGVTIDGDRLGLGVDLYSGKPTLAEQMGLENLNTELLKNSEYYTKKLLYEH